MKEHDIILQAKKSLKAHISFFENLIEHLKSPNKNLRYRAVWATWCLHRYIDERLINDINESIRANTPPDENHPQ